MVALMNRGIQTRSCAGVVLAALLTSCLVGCIGTSQSGPSSSTETGNPPSIRALEVALVVAGDGVSIVGGPGAVTPSSARVFARSLLTGQVIVARVAADGSFALTLPDSAGGVFEVVASLGNQGDLDNTRLSSPAVLVSRSAARVSSYGDGATCSQQETEAHDFLLDVIATADNRCQDSDDCVLVTAANDCMTFCTPYAISQQGKALVDAVSSALPDTVCPGYADGTCMPPPKDCEVQAEQAACVTGMCVPIPVESPGGECECPAERLSWFMSLEGVLRGGRYVYNGCFGYNGLGYTDDYGTDCVTVLGARCSFPDLEVATEDVYAALSHPDVQAAIANGGAVISAESLTWHVDVEIENSASGEVVILSMPVRCPSCDMPEGLRALGDLLDRLGEPERVCGRCLSPTQYLDVAYTSAAPAGCRCTEDAADLCQPDPSGSRSVALSCVDYIWTAVEDGACAMEP